jgi:Ser/Thr protein kinase RdoA (MazF antagonist)
MLEQLLTEQYGLTNVSLTPAPRGFVAETYYVDSDSGHYFAKLVKPSLDAVTIEPTLPLLQELRHLGVEQITYPIPTISGQLSFPLDGGLFVLFNRIDGQWVFDFPLEPYVALLAEIHSLSDQIQSPLPRETYEMRFIPDLMAFCERLWTKRFKHPQEKALAKWVKERRSDLERDIATAEASIKLLSGSEYPFVLTHGDAPGNILYDGDGVYLVDWDTALFAPCERDTWFHRHNDEFLALYRHYVPGYEYNPLISRFYLYKRYLEDAFGFFDKVLSPESTDAEKEHNFKELVETCDEWLKPLMERDRE